MQTQGQVEALASDVVNKFLLRTMGRGSSVTTATLTPRVLVVHLRDVLTVTEKSLSNGEPQDRHRAEAMVRGIRDQIVRSGRDELAAALRDSIGRQPAAVLHDVDPASGDEVVVFTFAAEPASAGLAVVARPARDRRSSA